MQQLILTLKKTHDIWEECIEIDEKTLRDFTEKFADNAKKGSVPTYIENMIKSLKIVKENFLGIYI